MNIKIVRIGNSRGIRIPRSILDRCRIENHVDLAVQGEKIILAPVRKGPREDWEEFARRMGKRGDDALLVPDVFHEEGDLEW